MKKEEIVLIGEATPENIVPILQNYYELIYAVENKYPGETRHETALRYILEAEKSTEGAVKAI